METLNGDFLRLESNGQESKYPKEDIEGLKTQEGETGGKTKYSLQYYEVVGKYKSAARAIRRNHVTYIGLIAPKRPFNNRGNTSKRSHSRVLNEYKKRIYEQIKIR